MHKYVLIEHDGFPRHCVEGTTGERKLSFTLLQKRLFVEANNSLDLPKNLWKSNRQIVFRRRTADFLDNPKADRLLSRLRPASLILFGVGLERSLRRLALCLLARGFHVAFVPEACGCWNETEGDLARRLIIAKGGMEIHLDDLEDTFKNAARPRITRIYSKAIDPTGHRRNIAG
jgi:nicotinamidase-related amidase